MNMKKNKPLLLNSLEVQMITLALTAWNEKETLKKDLKEEKATLLNALKALEYIDEVDKAEEQKYL